MIMMGSYEGVICRGEKGTELSGGLAQGMHLKGGGKSEG